MSTPQNQSSDAPQSEQQSGVVYLSWVTAGKLHEATLAYELAQAQGILDTPGFDLLGHSGSGAVTGEARHRCSTCGFSEREFEKTGRLGCADCYATFSRHLAPMLGRMHRGKTHVGKAPRWAEKEQVHRNRLIYLEGEMASAIRREAYEEAATMRDQIRELRSEFQ